VLGRAAREPRVIAGIVLILIAIAVGLLEYRHIRAQADRDFAYCTRTPLPPDCTTARKPLTVVTTRSSDNGFRKEYSLSIATSGNTTLTLGVGAGTASHFAGQSSADVRSRNGHESVILADDGTAVEVPFIFSLHIAAIGGVTIALGLLGAGSIAWGLTRVNRSPARRSDLPR
jgi:hypothetical protein